jgi:hypothetical protein
MTQNAQVWRNNKYFTFNTLMYYTVYFKFRALILALFPIRTSHILPTMFQVISRRTATMKARLQSQTSSCGNFLINIFKTAHPLSVAKPILVEFFNKYFQNCIPTLFRTYLLPHHMLHHPRELWHLSYILYCITCHKNMLSFYVNKSHVSEQELGSINHSSDSVSVGGLLNGFLARICSKRVSD